MEIREFQRLVIDKAKKAGFDDCEIYYQGGDSFQVLVNGGEIEHYETSSSSGASFRGIINDKVGFAYTERLDENAADFIIKAAAENAAIAEDDEECILFGGGEYEDLPLYNDRLAAAGTEEKINKITVAEKAALDYSDSVRAADRCIYADEDSQVSIMNTKGLDAGFKSNSMAAFVSVIAEKDGDIKTGGDFFAGNDFDKFDAVKLGEDSASEAVNMLGAESVKSGVYDVIIKNTAMSSIFSTFSGSFTGEQAYKGLSMLEGKEGQKIAADCVTIRDDGLLEGGYSTMPFDGEGVPCKNKEVMKDGVLKTLLYDLKYAAKKGIESTGNGFRSGYRSPIACSYTNFYICPSKTSLEELAEHVGCGIYITNVEGLHAGANPVSGDFSLSAEGFLIENGRITSPVEQITVASNFFRLLENIAEVGSDLRFSMDGAGSPAVYVKNVSISGL
ncbi:MAG: TldD/PmbA family protein [Clostridiales bacterium]|nr:TldD/PmbA family protein [Clostridiales bacterium]